jgi:hypothetical protein
MCRRHHSCKSSWRLDYRCYHLKTVVTCPSRCWETNAEYRIPFACDRNIDKWTVIVLVQRILLCSLIWNQEYPSAPPTPTPSDDITSLANKLLLFTANSHISTASEQSKDIMHYSPHGQGGHKVFFYLLLCNIVFLLLNNIFVTKEPKMSTPCMKDQCVAWFTHTHTHKVISPSQCEHNVTDVHHTVHTLYAPTSFLLT